MLKPTKELYFDVLFTNKHSVEEIEIASYKNLRHETKLIINGRHVISRIVTDKSTEFIMGCDFNLLNNLEL